MTVQTLRPQTPCRFNRAALAAATLSLLCFAAIAQAQVSKPVAPQVAATNATAPKTPGLTRMASVEGITEYRLANGMAVLLAPDASKPSTTVNMTYLVGSRHENYGETGMAHLLEHLIFKGTPTTANALAEFSKRGLRANGTTWVDRTNYFASFASNDDTLQWYLGWQADAMINSFIARKDLDTEMTVVRNEMEMGENSPFRVLYERMLATAYQWHNYGKSTIGARSDVENVNIERLQVFYRNYYQPDNAVLVISGQFDEAKVLAWVNTSFGKLKRPARKLAPQYTIEASQDGERSVTVRRTGNTQMLMAMYHTVPGAHPDAAAVALLPFLLGDSPAGRLHKSLVEGKLAASIWGIYWPTQGPGTMTFGAQIPPEQDSASARDKLLTTIESLAKEPLTQQELERAKANWIKDWELNYTNPEEVGVQLSEYIAQGDWRLMFLTRDRVKAVALADVQRVATAYLLPANRTFGAFVPTTAPARAPAPAFADASVQIKDYKGDQNFKVVAAFDITPANIDAKTKTVKLANGMTLVMLPKPTRGDLVNVQLAMRMGSETSLKGVGIVAGATGGMLLRGTPSMTRQALQDEFDKLKATVGAGASATSASVGIAVPRAGLAGTLKIVADAVRNATFPDAEFDDLKRAILTQVQAASKEPEPLGQNALNRHGNRYPAGDVRAEQTFEQSIAQIQALKVSELREFHARFYGANHAILTLVGDFDAAEVEAQVASLFGSWNAKEAYVRVPRPSYARPTADLVVNVLDKANAYFWARSHFELQDNSPDFAAFTLANYLLGRSESSRLWMRIRETDGLSYDVRTVPDVSVYEPAATWTASAIMAPANLPKVRKAFDEELARALKDGFTDAEVKQGRDGILRLRKLSRAQDDNLASSLQTNAAVGRNFAVSAKLDAQYAAMTAAEVNAALRKYLKPESFYFVSSGSLEKK